MEAEKQSEIAHEIRVPSHRLYLDESGDHRYDNVEAEQIKFMGENVPHTCGDEPIFL